MHFESEVEDRWETQSLPVLSEEPFDSTDVVFVDDKDLNLETANLHALDLYSDPPQVFSGDEDIFYDCQPDFNFSTSDNRKPMVLHDCSTIFKVPVRSSSLGDDVSTEVETCRTIKRVEKKLLHVPIQVCGQRIHALVDTGAMSCFI